MTKDTIRTESGEWHAFGGASYPAVMAKKLGCDTTILCRGDSNDKDQLVWISYLHGIGIKILMQPGENTCFVNDYSSGKRKQMLLSHSGKIDYNLNKRYDIIHLNPLYQEVGLGFAKEAKDHADLLLADAQGFVRTARNKRVSGRFWEEREEFLPLFDVLKVGIDELPYVTRLPYEPSRRYYRKVCKELHEMGARIVTLTLGENGSISYNGRKFYEVGVYKTDVKNETGAGDVFISAFGVKRKEGGNVREATLFGTAAASTVLEGFGPDCIGDRSLIENRYAELKRMYPV